MRITVDSEGRSGLYLLNRNGWGRKTGMRPQRRGSSASGRSREPKKKMLDHLGQEPVPWLTRKEILVS